MFIPNPENKPEIDHINTIRDDNRVENLRWVTHKENSNNPITLKRSSESMNGKYKGENNPFYGKHHTEETKKKLSEIRKTNFSGENAPWYGKYGADNHSSKPVYCIELDKSWNSIKECAKELNLHSTAISAVCRGKYKTTGKKHFIFLNKK